MNPEIIDVFCHYLPERFYEEAMAFSKLPLPMLKRARTIPAMVDADIRCRLMDGFPGYRQVPSLVSPPLECMAEPDVTPKLARIANEAMAALVEKDPYKFPGFVAALPMNTMDKALMEAEFSIKELGACGVQVFTNVNGRPLDEPDILQLFRLMASLERPIWLHPARGMNFPDYPSEKHSRYELWWALGWPYETSAAMARLVFAGVFDRWPDLKVITHHAGGMIPMLEGRLGAGMDLMGSRTPVEMKEAVQTGLKQRPVEAFRKFLADSASFGSKSAIECAIAFFGIDRILFATDMPFDPEQGPGYIRDTIKAVRNMSISEADKLKIFSGNVRKLLHL